MSNRVEPSQGLTFNLISLPCVDIVWWYLTWYCVHYSFVLVRSSVVDLFCLVYKVKHIGLTRGIHSYYRKLPHSQRICFLLLGPSYCICLANTAVVFFNMCVYELSKLGQIISLLNVKTLKC
jgi:hypothetical protein